MSSANYFSDLNPDRRLRAAVLAGGVLAGIAGVALIANLPATTTTRALLAVLWLILSGSETVHIAGAYRRCSTLRLNNAGGLRVLQADGCWTDARLLPDSVVLAQQAWLRVGLADGLEYLEWVRGDGRQSQQWRRFQVIWRHL